MKKTTWLVILITLAAFALRVYRLDAVSLRGDEAFTVLFVQRTWEGLWKGIRLIEPNPPLYYLALRVWVAVAGASELVTRYFSAFFGVLCVPLTYRLARVIFDRPVTTRHAVAKTLPVRQWRTIRHFSPRDDSIPLIAAALVAINPYQIWHSQDVRNYTLWPALTLLALVFMWRWWRLETRERRLEIKSNLQPLISNLILYVLATTASLYTHYYDTFTLVAENVFVFAFALAARRWKTLARWIGAQVVLAVVYLPWVLFGTNRITTYGEGSAEQSVPLLDQFSRTIGALVLGDTLPELWKTVLWLPLALAAAAVLIYLLRGNRESAAFLCLYIAVPTLALYLISMNRPLFLPRYLNGIAPAYYLVFAAGLAGVMNSQFLARITNGQLRAAVFTVGILFFVTSSAFGLANYYFNPAYSKAPDWRGLARFILSRQQPGDYVVQNYTDISSIYYLGGALSVMTLPKDFMPAPADEKTLAQLNVNNRRIWFIPAPPDYWDPEHFVENYLARHDDRLLERTFTWQRLQLYLTPSEFQSSMVPVNARLGNATLVGYRMEEARLLHVVLYWRAVQPIEKDFTVFIHLADANDGVVAQHDSAPVGGAYPTTAWQPGELIVDASDLSGAMTAGVYALYVGMYDPANPAARVPAFDASGARLPDDRVRLTQITISQ